MPIETVCQLFYRSVDTYKKAEHLKYRAPEGWKGISSDEFRTAVEEVSMGLRALGLAEGDRAAIFSENRPEWAIADLATLCAGAADAPVYATLDHPPGGLRPQGLRGEGRLRVHAGPRGEDQRGAAPAPDLQHVVRFADEDLPGTMGFDELRAKGREALATDPEAVRTRAAEVKGDDVATLIYTSGTTGDPKGVMLTHTNLVSNVLAAEKAIPVLGPEDVALSFLPLCHSFERTAGHNFMLHSGVTIAYAESVEKVPENMQEIRPTVMCSVPRLYEKMYARVNEKVAAEPAAPAEDLPLGDRRGSRGLRPLRGPHHPGSLPQAQVRGRRQARLLEDQGAHRGPAQALRLRGRPPGPGDRRVLRRGGPPGLRGLRPHRDQPGHHLQPARQPPPRHRGPAPRPAWRSRSPRTARSSAGVPTS